MTSTKTNSHGKRSGGPRTASGKTTSCRNALNWLGSLP